MPIDDIIEGVASFINQDNFPPASYFVAAREP